MNSRRTSLKKLFLIPLLSLSGFVNAHTPYRQWKVVRKKHLLIYSNREDLKTDLLAEQVNKVLTKTLKESIKYRGISDVDVGVFLSGGIDSSTNAYFFSKNSKKKIKVI